MNRLVEFIILILRDTCGFIGVIPNGSKEQSDVSVLVFNEETSLDSSHSGNVGSHSVSHVLDKTTSVVLVGVCASKDHSDKPGELAVSELEVGSLEDLRLVAVKIDKSSNSFNLSLFVDLALIKDMFAELDGGDLVLG